jgi:hypothetical protein
VDEESRVIGSLYPGIITINSLFEDIGLKKVYGSLEEEVI